MSIILWFKQSKAFNKSRNTAVATPLSFISRHRYLFQLDFLLIENKIDTWTVKSVYYEMPVLILFFVLLSPVLITKNESINNLLEY